MQRFFVLSKSHKRGRQKGHSEHWTDIRVNQIKNHRRRNEAPCVLTWLKITCLRPKEYVSRYFHSATCTSFHTRVPTQRSETSDESTTCKACFASRSATFDNLERRLSAIQCRITLTRTSMCPYAAQSAMSYDLESCGAVAPQTCGAYQDQVQEQFSNTQPVAAREPKLQSSESDQEVAKVCFVCDHATLPCCARELTERENKISSVCAKVEHLFRRGVGTNCAHRFRAGFHQRHQASARNVC